MHRQQDIDKVLSKFPISDVWGIGRKMLIKLHERNIYTARDYALMQPNVVRSLFGLPGLRTWQELRGESCIDISVTNEAKQSICNSRSFMREITDVDTLSEQIANFAAMTAEKLRHQGSVCSELHVSALTNRHRENVPQSYISTIVSFTEPTNSSRVIVKAAVNALREIYIKGYGYKKAGVVATKIMPQDGFTRNLFDDNFRRAKESNLTKAMDEITTKIGSGTIRLGAQGKGRILMSNEHRSPCYTTRWEDIPVITLK